MGYEHKRIEKKWRALWAERGTYRVDNDPSRPKYYVLDMFPYPSGAGLHVGHPLGYIASDIVARYKRNRGFNVLHPMGYDSFGLPAEQYAIQTGQHPARTTEENTRRYREQLDRIGFSFDWSRQVYTSDPDFYHWTQWIFLQLFDSWYDHAQDKARPLFELVARFEENGWSGADDSAITGNEELDPLPPFAAAEWKAFDEAQQQRILQRFRLAYLSEAWVNWCPALGTVLANDEVKDGVSERGGHPVERKRMPQWSMRITAYAQRLLDGLDTLEWSESIKEAQRNWIGRSEGARITFQSKDSDARIDVFTTRPDTLFGVAFVTLAPEHELIERITPADRRDEVMAYVTTAKNRSERERQTEVKRVSGVFTGAYVKHPLTHLDVPVWVGDYVHGGYGTGAVMAVPGGDQRDWNFATHFNIPFVAVTEGWDIRNGADESKEATLANSAFLNGLKVKDAIPRMIEELEAKGVGEGRINYRLRDAAFGRQRYWGEPIPIYYKDGVPYALPESELPLKLPEIDKYQPTETGEPPLARAKDWEYAGYPLETTTMPGWAGSSWYFLRYMDPHDRRRFASPEAINYWQQIDLYVGGSEHATGHLLYFRFWTKFLHDRGWVHFDEPAKKLVNQGMITGISKFATEVRVAPEIKSHWDRLPKELHVRKGEQVLKVFKMHVVDERSPAVGYHVYCSTDCKLRIDFYDPNLNEYLPTTRTEGRADSDFVSDAVVNGRPSFIIEPLEGGWLRSEPAYRPIIITDETTEGYWHHDADKRRWLTFEDEPIVPNRAFWTLRPEVEKMSKSKMNVVSPDNKPRPIIGVHRDKVHLDYYNLVGAEEVVIPGIIERYGADTLRLYEMFLGPLEQSKPWDTNGIEGTFRFLRKFWNLFHAEDADPLVSSAQRVDVTDEPPTKAELKVLHATLKKVSEDIERMSFNTSVSQFMIAVNELGTLKCNKRAVLEPLVIALSPFAPHIAEELWEELGHGTSISTATWPAWDAGYLVEDSFSYPISFNGKTRLQLEFPIALSKEEVEAQVLANPEVRQRLEGKEPKKVIVVPKRIVNIVV